jgi:single-strand DNA-binding protein
MSARSLNKVILIGNLTRDPELRYTPAGTAVCTFGLATNRSWVTQSGETKEETEFHRIVAWNKLGELCSQLLTKGRKIYTEGRLSTRTWTGQDGMQRTTTEIVIEDMIILDSKRPIIKEGDVNNTVQGVVSPQVQQVSQPVSAQSTEIDKEKKLEKKKEKVVKEVVKEVTNEDITPDDIPF